MDPPWTSADGAEHLHLGEPHVTYVTYATYITYATYADGAEHLRLGEPPPRRRPDRQFHGDGGRARRPRALARRAARCHPAPQPAALPVSWLHHHFSFRYLPQPSTYLTPTLDPTRTPQPTPQPNAQARAASYRARHVAERRVADTCPSRPLPNMARTATWPSVPPQARPSTPSSHRLPNSSRPSSARTPIASWRWLPSGGGRSARRSARRSRRATPTAVTRLRCRICMGRAAGMTTCSAT